MTNFESMSIIERITYLWDMPKDLSIGGGLFWFSVFTLVMVGGFFLMCWTEQRSR